ncbi:hypothetical protein CPTAKMNP4_259 [Salmonella phage vB_SenM-AKM_NP4]|uniref:Uncharacterized protein n=1 Tax=Salmonella phage S16 TaxID=1087482 RepID=M1HDM0_BPS16|nr:hypothetical protein I133_gp006 [Salmonella phage vB_SenM-S16]AGE48221.1 hypothetical protein [Salmonella phage vB_SenM-S16]WDR21923.1 hypothetical protein PJM34_0255 [Salmonella phage vB_SenM_UTK0003]WLI71881.1 hypothetical protein CPTAKMNP4_259 [Salmonella phage vB_SenM-AKM_NP4]
MLTLLIAAVWFGLAIYTAVTRESSFVAQFVAQLTLGLVLVITAFKQF